MAEATLRDVIKVLKQSDLNNQVDADLQTKNTAELRDEIGKLNKMLGSYFTKQNASKGDDLEKSREASKKSDQSQKEKNKPTTFRGGLSKGLGLDFLRNVAGIPGALLGAALGGGAIASLAPAFGLILGKTLKAGAVFGLLSLFGEGLLTKGLEKLTGKELGEGQAKEFNSVLSKSLAAAVLNKKLGIATFIGQMVGMSLPDSFSKENQKLLGIDLGITQETFATWGATIAAFFAPSLISGALTSAFTGKAPPTGATVGRDAKGRFTKLSNKNASMFRQGFKGRMGLGIAMTALGGVAGAALGDALGSEELGDTLGDGISAAGVGWMVGGPIGAIVAGIGTLAIAGLSTLADWMTQQNDKIKERTLKQLEKYENLSNESLAELDAENTAKVQAIAARAAQELERQRVLAGGNPLSEADQSKLDEANRLRENAPLDLSRGTTLEQLKVYMENAMAGNKASLDALIKLYKEVRPNADADDFYRDNLRRARSAGLGVEADEYAKLISNTMNAQNLMGYGVDKKAVRTADYLRMSKGDLMRDLPPVNNGGGGANGAPIVVNAPSTTGGTSNNAMLTGMSSATDKFSPH